MKQREKCQKDEKDFTKKTPHKKDFGLLAFIEKSGIILLLSLK